MQSSNLEYKQSIPFSLTAQEAQEALFLSSFLTETSMI